LYVDLVFPGQSVNLPKSVQLRTATNIASARAARMKVRLNVAICGSTGSTVL